LSAPEICTSAPLVPTRLALDRRTFVDARSLTMAYDNRLRFVRFVEATDPVLSPRTSA
jgi:hypothetical protein